MQYAVWIALAVVMIAIIPSLLKGKRSDDARSDGEDTGGSD